MYIYIYHDISIHSIHLQRSKVPKVFADPIVSIVVYTNLVTLLEPHLKKYVYIYICIYTYTIYMYIYVYICIYIHVVNGWLQVYNDPFIKLSIILKWGTATVGMAFIQWCAKRWMVIGWWLSGVFKSVQVGGTGVPNIVYIYVYICMYIVLILYINTKSTLELPSTSTTLVIT